MLSRLNFSEGVLGQHFLVKTNLRPKTFSEFFHLQSALVCEFFSGDVWVPTFSSHGKFEVKNSSEFLNLQSSLDSKFFREGVWAPTFFGHSKFEFKFFLEFFSLPSALD